jgi:hypothetical protein
LSQVEQETCINSQLERYKESINTFNTLVTEWPIVDLDPLNEKTNDNKQDVHIGEENLFLPYTGNGYIGISINSKQGLYANYHKSLSLPIMYNPLVNIYSDTMSKKGSKNSM